MTNQSRGVLILKKNLQHIAAYLLHTVIKMLHIGFGLYNLLYKAENLKIGVVLHDKEI